jgi:hypothetical protein
MDGSRFATRPSAHSSGSGMVMSLNSFPLLRDSHMASKPLFTTCVSGGVGERNGKRFRGVAGLVAWIALARLSRGRRPRRVHRGKVRSESGGWAYLFTDERAGDDDGDVHARALRGGVEARDGAVAVRLDRGRAGVFCRWSRARSVEARLRIPAVAKRHAPTSRSCRTLRTWCPRLCLRGSLRALRTLPARGRGGATQT